MDPAPLGRGSYGEVTGATHNASGARRAIKSVGKAHLKRYVNNVTSFVRREVDILRRLDHPNIVRLYEAYEDEHTIYLVLECCDGGDLLERVAVARERLPEREAAVLFSQMLGAVQHLYLRGIVHRDLKPENFLFAKREPEREPLPPQVAPVKLIDFGLSRRLSSEASTRITPKIGTTEYMAPEAYAGRINPALADRTDMWSMGVILHVIFIGHFPSPKLAEQSSEEYLAAPCWKRLSAQARDILAQLLRFEPARRPLVTVMLKHPWLSGALDEGKLAMVLPMPGAVRAFAKSPGLRRLALAAAAREVDDCDLHYVRCLFQSLELECDGGLTRLALEKAAWSQGTTGSTAQELSHSFELIDSDGSGTIDWTEFVAVALGRAKPSASSDTEPIVGADSDTGKDKCTNGMPALRHETCFQAFDLLSQGTGTVSGQSLGSLFYPSEAACWSGGGTGGSADGVLSGESQRVSELDKMVREVESRGSINPDAFARG
jgi:calcium-dependent protein kinase